MPPDGQEPTAPIPPSRKFLLALVIILLVYAFILVRHYLGAVVMAIVLGYLLHPVYRRLARAVRWGWLASGLVLLLLTAAVVAPLVFIAFQLVDEARLVVEIARDPDRIQGAVVDILAPFGVSRPQAAELVSLAVERGAALLEGAVVSALTGLAFALASLIVFYFLLFFVLRDGDKLLEWTRELTPLAEPERTRLFVLVGDRIRAIILGTFLIGIVQGIAAGLGWWFLGFPAPFFWGFVMAVIAVLPFAAPFLIMVPAGLWALSQGDMFAGIGIIVWSAVIVGLIDDVIRPWVVGKRAGVHPAIILVGTLGGILVFGAVGFLLGPLLLGMLGPVLEVWAEERRDAVGPTMPPPS